MTDHPPPYDTLIDYVAAAHGDPDACFRLLQVARAAVLDGSDDPLTGSMEGATLARLAALRGSIMAAVLMAEHLNTVARLYDEAGDSTHAEFSCAESLAILELSEAYPVPGWEPAAWSDHIQGIVTETALQTDANFMALIKHYRTIWAPFLDPLIVQPAGDKRQ